MFDRKNRRKETPSQAQDRRELFNIERMRLAQHQHGLSTRI